MKKAAFLLAILASSSVNATSILADDIYVYRDNNAPKPVKFSFEFNVNEGQVVDGDSSGLLHSTHTKIAGEKIYGRYSSYTTMQVITGVESEINEKKNIKVSKPIEETIYDGFSIYVLDLGKGKYTYSYEYYSKPVFEYSMIDNIEVTTAKGQVINTSSSTLELQVNKKLCLDKSISTMEDKKITNELCITILK